MYKIMKRPTIFYEVIQFNTLIRRRFGGSKIKPINKQEAKNRRNKQGVPLGDGLLGLFFRPQYGETKFLRNVGELLPYYMAQHPKRWH
jgi:hypothetical protein